MLKRVFALLLLAAAASGLSAAPAAAQGALIYGSDAISSPNTVSLPTSSDGWFMEGGSGVNGTQVTDYWLNKVGGELNSAIIAAPCSATINMSAYNQLSACLQYLQSEIAALAPAFTPVQQGGGPSQGANKINLGWNNGTARPRMAVDGSDVGDLPLMSGYSHFANAGGGWRKSPDGYIAQWGHANTGSTGNVTITTPISFSSFFTFLSISCTSLGGGANIVDCTIGSANSFGAVGKIVPTGTSGPIAPGDVSFSYYITGY